MVGGREIDIKGEERQDKRERDTHRAIEGGMEDER